jgi:hypothetical protein
MVMEAFGSIARCHDSRIPTVSTPGAFNRINLATLLGICKGKEGCQEEASHNPK